MLKFFDPPGLKNFKIFRTPGGGVQKFHNKYYINQVKEIKGMFINCLSLEEINFNKFNANNITDMSEHEPKMIWASWSCT